LLNWRALPFQQTDTWGTRQAILVRSQNVPIQFAIIEARNRSFHHPAVLTDIVLVLDLCF
jgi:hypothetical protein